MDYSKVQFFDKYNLEIGSNYTSGNDYGSGECKSVDGSGHIASVNDLNSPYIVKYIKELGFKTVLDIGAGLGYLQQAAELDGQDSYYSIEGAASLADQVVCNKKQYCVYDITKGTDETLYGCFDLTTSFEVIEHIHRDEQNRYWDAIEKLAPMHLCSIHVTGGEHALHKTVLTPDKWMDFFNKRGYLYRVLHHFPVSKDLNLQTQWNLSGWDCSVVFLLKVS